MKLLYLALSLLIPIYFSLLTTSYASKDLPSLFLQNSGANPLNILLLTAHPDDECMFFAPTILALTGVDTHTPASSQDSSLEKGEGEERFNVYSLCLSSGNADGLGETRKRELAGSLDVLGIPEGRRWVLDEPFADNITAMWDTGLIVEHVMPYIVKHEIDVILTFDVQGVSSHPNHISLASGVKALINQDNLNRYSELRAYSLLTVPLIPKYTGQLSASLKIIELRLCELFGNSKGADTVFGYANLCTAAKQSTFISSYRRYMTALKAMMQHRSQLVWFRWLYVSFSRYMWVNDWIEILPDKV